jgi:endonuclease-3
MTAHARRIIEFLEERYGPLRHRYNEDPFRLLISCVISQRTRDETTERVSKRLLSVASTPAKILNLPTAKLQGLIKSSGTYRQKAKNIKAIAKIVMEKYHNRVPKDRAKLMELPGIGPKCSAIVLSYGFGVPIIAIDVNVERISKRLGLAGERDNIEVVREKLQKFFPRKKWLEVNVGMVQFGREICLPRNPRCVKCQLLKICPYGQLRFRTP